MFYIYVEDIVLLVCEVDFLVMIMLGGVGMWVLVNVEVLEVLGFKGFFINVVCGLVVDEKVFIVVL